MRLGPILLFISVAVVTESAPARADIAPPDACTSPDQPCTNVMTSQSGTCRAMTCARVVPDGDGGTTTMSYACMRCVPTDTGAGGAGGASSPGGAGGASSAGGAGGTTTGSGGAAPSPTKKDGGGCSIAPAAREGDGWFMMVGAVGLLALMRRRIGPRRSRSAR